MEKYQQVQACLKALESDFNKFYDKGNKAAGVRLRKGMQELKEVAQGIRVDIQNRKND
jgi:hypothetical protein